VTDHLATRLRDAEECIEAIRRKLAGPNGGTPPHNIMRALEQIILRAEGVEVAEARIDYLAWLLGTPHVEQAVERLVGECGLLAGEGR